MWRKEWRRLMESLWFLGDHHHGEGSFPFFLFPCACCTRLTRPPSEEQLCKQFWPRPLVLIIPWHVSFFDETNEWSKTTFVYESRIRSQTMITSLLFLLGRWCYGGCWQTRSKRQVLLNSRSPGRPACRSGGLSVGVGGLLRASQAENVL